MRALSHDRITTACQRLRATAVARVPGTGVPVVETGGDCPSGGDLGDAAVPGAGEQRVPLHHRDHLCDRVVVSLGDPGLQARRGQCPQHARGLRHGEGQVETGDRGRGTPAPFLGFGSRDRLSPILVGQVLGESSHSVGDSLLRAAVNHVPGAQPLPAERVLAAPVEPAHLLLRDHRPGDRATCHMGRPASHTACHTPGQRAW
jgi:hypothetical protein